MRHRWYEPTRRNYDRTLRAECGRCPVAGPDEYGQYEVMEVWDCPVHGEARPEGRGSGER